MKKQKPHLSITIDPDVDKILEDMAINKSKLINKLLREYLDGLTKDKPQK